MLWVTSQKAFCLREVKAGRTCVTGFPQADLYAWRHKAPVQNLGCQKWNEVMWQCSATLPPVTPLPSPVSKQIQSIDPMIGVSVHNVFESPSLGYCFNVRMVCIQKPDTHLHCFLTKGMPRTTGTRWNFFFFLYPPIHVLVCDSGNADGSSYHSALQ